MLPRPGRPRSTRVDELRERERETERERGQKPRESKKQVETRFIDVSFVRGVGHVELQPSRSSIVPHDPIRTGTGRRRPDGDAVGSNPGGLGEGPSGPSLHLSPYLVEVARQSLPILPSSSSTRHSRSRPSSPPLNTRIPSVEYTRARMAPCPCASIVCST
jgi:hypothetical protein